jgi:phosphate transport system ATP-binding protein
VTDDPFARLSALRRPALPEIPRPLRDARSDEVDFEPAAAYEPTAAYEPAAPVPIEGDPLDGEGPTAVALATPEPDHHTAFDRDGTSVAAVDPLAGRAPVRLVGGPPPGAARIEARGTHAWFGDHLVLEGVDLAMPAGEVTALIGPSGCGKSTFLRLLNRMHELVPSAALAGEVLLDGQDIYDSGVRAQQVRMRIGMVFQKPNPFPAMSIRDNVLSGLKLARIRCDDKDELVEQSLLRAGLWREVRDRLADPGGALSGGQQQRLCIARALAVQPNVLLMDEPCSALDPTSTRRIEDTIAELRDRVTVVIVTHNMQQAHRVSDHCAFFLAEENEPGRVIEHGPTEAMFTTPADARTLAYVEGRFG